MKYNQLLISGIAIISLSLTSPVMAYNTQNLNEKLIVIISNVLKINDTSKIHPNSLLKEDLGADNIDIIELKIAIKDKLNIQLSIEEFSKVKTVDNLESLIKSHMTSSNG